MYIYICMYVYIHARYNIAYSCILVYSLFLVGFKNNKSSYKTNLTKNATGVI